MIRPFNKRYLGEYQPEQLGAVKVDVLLACPDQRNKPRCVEGGGLENH